MESAKERGYRKREYILVKHGLKYYYARADRERPELYHIMVNVGEREGMHIIEKANATSEYNEQMDAAFMPVSAHAPSKPAARKKANAKKDG